jgi:ArsR family transcriptional regulator
MENFLKTTGALYDETRVQMLHFIAQKEEVCVCEIEQAFGMIQSRISRHLKILKEAGFLRVERRGKWAYYAIRTPLDLFRQACLKEISYLDVPTRSTFTCKGEA